MSITYEKCSRRTALGWLLVASLESPAAQCVTEARELRLGEPGTDPLKLRSYTCAVGRGQQLRAQFCRLNDMAAGLLLNGAPAPPMLTVVYDGGRIVQNDVLREYEYMLRVFGENISPEATQQIYNYPKDLRGILSTGFRVLAGGTSYGAAYGDYTEIDFPDPTALRSLSNEKTIPPRYTEDNDHSIWRYMGIDDLLNYEEKVRDYNRLIRGNFEEQFKGFRSDSVHGNIKLYRYLAQNGWPDDFIPILGLRDDQDGCGSRTKYWRFFYHAREPLLDVLVLENLSSSNITLDTLLGESSGEKRLRPVRRQALAGGAAPVIQKLAVDIPPGGRIVVPVRILWGIPDKLRNQFERSTRKPKMTNYAWGPEFDVVGIQTNGTSIYFEGNATNYFEVTTSCGCGSCPYLYAWDREAREWVNTGKILEASKGKPNASVEWRKFDGPVLQFKVAELEAELAYIYDIYLELTMSNGVRRSVFGSIIEQDKTAISMQPFDIGFGESMEIVFNLPAEVNELEIETSNFFIYGYYLRYSDILYDGHFLKTVA